MAKILPKEFRQLEYIESSGTQYIDTGIYSKNITSAEVKFNISNTNNFTGFGDTSVGTGSGYPASMWCENSAIKWYYSEGSPITLGSHDTDITATLPFPAQTAGSTVHIFHATGAVTDKCATGKYYYVRLLNGTNIVFNAIPAKRISDSEIGMYDLVSKTFFANAGKSTFVAGPVIDVDENAYDELEYIECTGTQYIDTTFKANQNTSAEVEFSPKETPSNIGIAVLFGSSGSWSNASYGFYKFSTWYSNYNSDDAISSIEIPVGTKTKLYKNKNLVYIDDTLVYTHTNATFQSANNLLLGKISISKQYGSYAKFYSCKIWDNGTLVRNLIPVKHKSDSAIGMVDTLTDTFYANAGTGTFIPGPSVNSKQIAMYKRSILSSRLPAGYTELEYIESSGTQYIDTGIDGTNKTAVWNATVENLSSGAQKALISSGYAQTVRNAYGTFIYNNTWSASGNNLGEVIATGKQNIVSTTIINTSGNTSTTIVVDGVQSSIVERVYAASHNMGNTTLFASKVDASTMTSGGNFKLYSASCSLDDTLVRNFIPAKNNSNVLGMYDLVTNQFFTNQGTGDFIAGPEKVNYKTTNTYKTSIVYRPSSDKTGLTTQSRTPSPADAVYPTNVAPYKLNGIGAYADKYYAKGLPDGYTQLEYVNMTTSGGYIDTGIKAQHEAFKVEIDATLYSPQGTLGAQVGSYNTSTHLIYGNSLYVGDDGPISAGIFSQLTRGTIILESTADKNYSITQYDGTVVTGTYTGTIISNKNYYLYGTNAASLNASSTGTIYSVKFYDNGVLVGHFVPAKNSSDEIGMYNIVDDTFHKKQGSGTLIAGPEVQTLAPTIIRKVGVKVLDGTNLTFVVTSWDSGVACKHTDLGALPYDSGGTYDLFKCSHLPVSSGIDANDTLKITSSVYGIHFNFDTAIIPAGTPTSERVAIVNSWLAQQYNQGRPVVIYYPLATNVVEQAPLACLNSYKEVVQYRP